MRIDMCPTNKLGMKLLDSYDVLKKVVSGVTYSQDGKNIVGNYGKWKLKYKRKDIEGFVTSDGLINRNGKQITINPGFIVETEEKNVQPLFNNIIKMLTDMTKNIQNPTIVNREHNMFSLDMKQIIKAGNEALKKASEHIDK